MHLFRLELWGPSEEVISCVAGWCHLLKSQIVSNPACRCTLLQHCHQAAVLVSLLGLFYTVKTMKALELPSSLLSPLDYSVSMDTWLQFPLQSANQGLKMGWRSITLLWCLFPSRCCFVFVSSSSILQGSPIIFWLHIFYFSIWGWTFSSFFWLVLF